MMGLPSEKSLSRLCDDCTPKNARNTLRMYLSQVTGKDNCLGHHTSWLDDLPNY